MATFKRLKLDDASGTMIDVNLDQVSYMEPRNGYTTIYFAGNRTVDVKETTTEILNKQSVS